MEQVQGYTPSETLFHSAHSLVVRAIRDSDGRRVVLKHLASPHPAQRDVVRLRHEQRILEALSPQRGLPQPYGLETYGRSPLLVTEDIGATSLSRLLEAGPMALRPLLELAVQVLQALEGVHEGRVIHKDVTPGNVVWNPHTRRAQLIDFGIASQVTREVPSVLNRGLLEGTLAYMSPEQTGRTNRSLDYRTDLYSLGATLFHALAGEPPFPEGDFMELVHSHIARQPPLLHERRPEVPVTVSLIVERLLAKAPESRYQSAYAARLDFERCLSELSALGLVSPFPLGSKDVSDRFAIPQRLYGRAAEIEALLEVFDRTSLGSRELALVSGYAGIGKSALVRELYGPIVAKRGYFISGKCDQIENVPFACLIEACSELLRQILTEPEQRVAAWRRRLSEALGPNGQVVVEVVPEVERVIGPQPALPILPPLEAENRFNLTFERFLRAFTDPAHPLVVFLDDLQWADNPTLRLLQRLLTDPETRYLLLIGAYRDNEVDSLHPLSLCLEDLREAQAALCPITLTPLGEEHVRDLLADTLYCEAEEAAPLAAICRDKTAGNPFFLSRFLLDLYEREAFRFDPARARWSWSLREIEEMEVANNVVALLTKKLDTLPEETRAALQLAACLGNTFDLQSLGTARERPVAETARDLWPSVDAGLILPLGADYHFIGPEGEDAEQLEGVSYRFLHDRVQQAAYGLAETEEQRAAHRRIGLRLLEQLSPAAQEERLFELVGQLNRGPTPTQGERDRLAALNLRAGLKALNSAAFQPALVYLERGLGLVEEGGWSSRYPLTLELHVQAANAAYRASRYERSDALVEAVLTHARSPLEKVDAYETRVLALVVQKRQRDAIAAALAFLAERGIHFPAQPTKLHVARALGDTKLALLGKQVEDFCSLPLMDDPAQLAAMRILVSISSAAYLTRQDLFPLLILRQMSLAARGGVIPHTAYALSTYGIILTGVLGDIDGGVRCGRTALKLLERLPRVGLECRTHFVHETFLRPWKEHAKHAWAALFSTYELGVETGDVEYAAYSSMTRVMFAFFIGRNLAEVDEEIARWTGLQAKFRHEAALHYTRIYWQAIQNLRGQAEDPCRLVGEAYDEDERLPHLAGDGFARCSIHLHKLVLNYHFGTLDEALRCGEVAERHLENYLAFPLQTVFHLYDALARIRAAEGARGGARWRLLRGARRHLKTLRKFCKHSPENHLHRVALIEAELARVSGQEARARASYEEAIAAARAHEYVNDEALALELSARFYAERGNEIVARAYRNEAIYAYERWGAQAKADLLRGELEEGTTRRERTQSYTGSDSIIDLQSVLKTSQAISSEIVLDQLVERVLVLLLENAGAERGLLILNGATGPRVVAEASTEDQRTPARLDLPLEEATGLSRAIAGYVLRTGESILLDDAQAAGEFVRDPYVLERSPRSVLCAPIVRTGQLTGVVYLENNLTPGAFTPERVEFVQLLSSQAAISLDNARLYASLEATTHELEAVNERLEARVQARTLQLEQSNAELGRALERVQAMQDRVVTQEKLASLGSLTAGIAHEIRNPLNFVNNFAALSVDIADELRDELSPDLERLPEERRGLLLDLLGDLHTNAGKINRYGQQAEGIVRGMLAHAGADQGQRESVDLVELVERHLSVSEEAARGGGLPLRVERAFAAELPPVLGLVQALSQVLVNLFDNACYALRERLAEEGSAGDYSPTLRVSAARTADWLELRVRDNGVGIRPEDQERIFRPFFTTKPTGVGVGFGLSLVHDIVTKVHGGELLVTSELGGYTEFVLRLPLAGGSGEHLSLSEPEAPS